MSATETRSQDSVLATAVKVLVVDARDDLREVLPASLRHRPLVIEHAQGSDAALACLNSHGFDVVLADIDMPDPGDVELLRRVRKECPGTKVIVISSGRDPSIVASILRQRAYLVLIRPMSGVRLMEAIEQALLSEGWEDDVELLSGTPDWFQLRIACKLQAAERAALIFHEVPPNLAPPELEEFATAFREMLMNAIEHGGRSDPQMSIYVNFVRTALALVVYIRDPGPGFNLRDLSHAAISNPDGTLAHTEVREQLGIRPGGFGILLAKNMVDELIYSERGNEVLLIKHRRKAV